MTVECHCLQCGKQFYISNASFERGEGKYCNRKCSGIASRKQVKHECRECHKVFYLPPCKIGNYCSRECLGKSKRRQTIYTCAVCGSSFSASPSRVERNIAPYCSLKCSTAAKTIKINNECKVCGKVFKCGPESNRIYCSRKCTGIAHSGKGHPLWRGGPRQYRGPNWFRNRKLAYMRDSGICQNCGALHSKNGRKNSIHHIKRYNDFVIEYGKEDAYIYANALSNLITLCASCHVLAENHKITFQPKLL